MKKELKKAISKIFPGGDAKERLKLVYYNFFGVVLKPSGSANQVMQGILILTYSSFFAKPNHRFCRFTN